MSLLLLRVRQLRRAVTQKRPFRSPQNRRLVLLIMVDVLLGLCVSRVAVPYLASTSARHSAARFLASAERAVAHLRSLIFWLMDAPAGLKLNSALSNALGRFFLYHVHLWLTFLHLSAPPIASALAAAPSTVSAILSLSGASTQLSLAQDAFALATFHVHCFHAYARRLFVSQTEGLTSLWRLFRGKKYNPLRKRVDSAESNVDQLFVGTMAFTILLFLYPTTIVYFAVFKSLELVIVSVNWVMGFLVKNLTSYGLQEEEMVL